MTITIDLPPEEEAPLRKRAARQSKGLDDFVQQIVRHEAELETQRERLESDVPQGQTLAEALKGLIGVLDSGKPGLVENTGEAFTDILVEKKKAGHL